MLLNLWNIAFTGFMSMSVVAYGYGLRANGLLVQREKELHKLAYYDVLTGLSNRLRFNEQSIQILENARKNKHRFAFIILDIDDFKSINDNYGHAIGDEFLKQIAARLEAIIEENCVGNSFVSRLGGDEIVIVIDEIRNGLQIHDANSVADLIHELYESLNEPVVINEMEIEVGISMGISLFPYDGTSVTTLLKAADLALYASKDDGKNTFFFHERKMSSRFERLYEYQTVVQYFVDTHDFQLRYQPVVDIKTATIKGAEVLFGGNKLKYPTLNVQEMIEVAEQSDDIILLGDLIFKRACQEFVDNIAPKVDPEFLLSVNVSVKQLNEDEFVQKIIKVLDETQMQPNKLCLEITETALMTNYRDIISKIEELKKIGVNFSIDDFGKGYSSMSYLRKLSVNKIKIDKSFIEDINDKKSNEIVKTLVIMSKTLGLTCIAEGVETEEQFKFLRSIDCDQIQGYLISPPMSIKLFEEFIVVMK